LLEGEGAQFAPLFLLFFNDTVFVTLNHNSMNPIKPILTGFLYFMLLSLFSQNAPVTKVSNMYNPPVGGLVVVPVTVSSFEDIGSISLILDYDPAVLTFQSALPNAAFNEFVVNGTSIPGRIIISWYATYGITLDNGDKLVEITFLNNGGTTAISWSSSDEGSCEYAKYDNGAFTVLNDMPFSQYYINGLVSSPSAPLTWAPVITHASPGELDIPIMVNGFNDIGAISLTLEYDPSVLAYQDIYVSNPELSAKGIWLIGSQDAPGGKKYIRISWTKNIQEPPQAPVNLPDNSSIVTLKFNYTGGTSDLLWMDDGASCEYADGDFNELDDMPAAVYYKDGLVTGQQYAPHTEMPCLSSIIGETVVFPVKVYGFTNIGAISLTLNYNPAVLTYQSISTPNIPLTYAIDANGISGTIIFGANGGTGFSLPDGSILVNITFVYNGGNCLLTWNDEDPIFCEYACADTYIPLWDQPRDDFYFDGCVGPAPAINGKVFLEGPYKTASGTMTTELNDQGVIPLTQPYDSLPWNYTGTEHVSAIPVDVTDWVLVQLRALPSASSVIAERAGFLLKNGTINGADGINLLAFAGIVPGYYYLVVYQRNHMAVMSSAPVQVNPYSSLYDFSSGPAAAFGGTSGLKLIDPLNNRWGMISSDARNDQNIYIDDYTDFWVPDFGLNSVYSPGDYNMDGKVYIDDYTDQWVPNFGITNSLP
jgi:hypothetical protein